MKSNRIGVFICHCGRNIAGTVDVKSLVKEISQLYGVVHCEDYKYMCSDPGQSLIRQKIKEKNIQALVVASCSPSLHERTFQRAIQQVGLNPYLLEIANIREQCSWIHQDIYYATKKAGAIIKSAIEKVRLNEALIPQKIPVTKRALVVGAGIAGIQASLDIANSGYEVVLVERSPSIGGHMAQLSETFPTLDCSQCILTPKMVDAGHHENIKLYTYSEIESVSGTVGNFRVKIRRKSTYVDYDKCNGCEDCVEVCPVSLSNEFDLGLSLRKAIYRPFPQAVPNKFTIDQRGIPPCRSACPAGVNVQAYVALSAQGKFAEALAKEREDNPFPSVCGRVCTHPCESRCKRSEVDAPVSIREIKRFLADYETELPRPVLPERKKERVAIIGAGPSGLSCAYFLARMGYNVDVFESSPLPGGLLRTAIPRFRLPRKSLEKDIEYIKSWGVVIKTNSKVDAPEKLLTQGYNAVYIATGAHIERKLGVEGEDLEGIYYGIDFLKRVNLSGAVKIGKRVQVVGGGNSAIDAARTALRLGAEEVSILYRRSRKEMPANAEEIEEAIREGIKIQFLTTPVKFIGEAGGLKEIECIKMKLGPLDESGRRRPEPIPGSEFRVPSDTVIITIGQIPDTAYLKEKLELRRGRIKVNDRGQTSVTGIFAGGDVVRGPATVIEAIGDGKSAASVIARYLQGLDLEALPEKPPEVKEVKIPPDIARVKPQTVQVLELEKRAGSFQEVNLGLNEEQVRLEAQRCLGCGGCAVCGECVKACEQKAIDYTLKDRVIEEEVGAIIVATGYDLYSIENFPEYGGGRYADVISGLQFERLLSASGPTRGEVKRPSDGKVPKRVAFISCVGSRDPEHHLAYCSKVCCMYNVKHALLYKERVPDGEPIIFTIDIRTAGKGYEEFLIRAKEHEKVTYIRGKPGRILKNRDGLVIWAEDTITQKPIKVHCDMVVLATAIIPSAQALTLAQKLNIHTDVTGFFN
ncbi:hypothetical protein BXT86_05725, partial [candidate division WOR-3 bacterium 4484_100]